MSLDHIHSEAYAKRYLDTHTDSQNQAYRMGYWNHFFVDSIMNAAKEGHTHLLEEGGGTCGIWRSLSFDRYTSVDISDSMTTAAGTLYPNDSNKQFILGDIFSGSLSPGGYSAIVANAFGVYYRPDVDHLRRFHELLAPNGVLFLAIDPVLTLKHFLAQPVADLVDKRVRPYLRISPGSFAEMITSAGFQLWLTADYTPAPNWKRRAFFLTKS
jgi:SAM-dependent methyltransferase